MSKADDYKICPALFGAYIAKVSKRNPNLMLEDRREISTNEILCLIDWYVDKRCNELNKDTFDITADGNPIIEIKKLNFVPKKEENKD